MTNKRPRAIDQLVSQSKQTLKDRKIDAKGDSSVLASLWELKSLERAQEDLHEREETSVDKARHRVEELHKRIADLRAHNAALARAQMAQARNVNQEQAGFENVFAAISEARVIEKERNTLLAKKQQLLLRANELKAQLKLTQGPGASLGRELKPLEKYISLRPDVAGAVVVTSAEEAALQSELKDALFVLFCSARVALNLNKAEWNLRCWIERYAGEAPIHPFTVCVGRDSGDKPLLVFGYSNRLDAIVVSGNLQSLAALKKLDPHDDGLTCPSLVTAYKLDMNEPEELAVLGEFRPYKWAQSVCGIRCVRSLSDLKKQPLQIDDVLKLIK